MNYDLRSETYIEIFIFSGFDGQDHRQNKSIYLTELFSWCTVLKKECIFSYIWLCFNRGSEVCGLHVPPVGPGDV